MKLWEYTTDDVDEMVAHLAKAGSDNEEIQLTAGRLGFRASVIELPGVSIRWNRFGQSLLFRQVIQREAFRFGFLLERSPPLHHSGIHIPAGQGILQAPLSEHEYVNGRQTESLIVSVSLEIAQKLGWHLSSDVTHKFQATTRNALIRQCRKITATAKCSAPIDRFDELALRDDLLDHLTRAVEPWMRVKNKDGSEGQSNRAAYYVFRRAVKAVAQNQWESLSIPALAEYVKVSERTLYRAFDRWVGIGPYEFFTLSRLHAFRRDLVTGDPHRGKIARAARINGFDELSRLAQNYKRHFGELPSETLAKRSELSGRAAGS